MKRLLKIFTILFFGIVANAQEFQVKEDSSHNRFRKIDIKFHAGMHFYGGDGLQSDLKDGYGAVELRYAWQTTEKDEWAKKYGYPDYGVGLYSGFIGNPSVLGKPNALYGFINFPLSKPFRKNQFFIGPALGLTYDLQPYDAGSNPLNDAIGAKMAVYFNVNYGASIALNREIDFTYGVDFTHFSNGRSFTPNWGLNMFGINAGFTYYYNGLQRKIDKSIHPQVILPNRFQKKTQEKNTPINENSIRLYGAIGTTQNYAEEGTDGGDKRYFNFSAVLDYQYKFNNMHSVTGGFDLFYDGSLAGINNPPDSNFMPAIHLGYGFMFYKFTIHLQAGTYLVNDQGKGLLFLRPALEYVLTKDLSLQIGLKTKNGGSADWVEFGVVFYPFKW